MSNMTPIPPVRQFALTTHITASVGWLGAVVVFLGHATIGLTSEDPYVVRGVYLVMEPAAWLALLPLAVAALLSGIIQSLVSPWGLLRHYWVVFKLVITACATVILLIYMATFRQMAAVAADPGVAIEAVRNPSPAIHAGLALAVLMIATVLAVYKPARLTPYGRRARAESITPICTGTWMHGAAVVAIVLMLLMIAFHLTGHGPASH
jgi:hypothetical protein